jgi:hypothetical protein
MRKEASLESRHSQKREEGPGKNKKQVRTSSSGVLDIFQRILGIISVQHLPVHCHCLRYR